MSGSVVISIKGMPNRSKRNTVNSGSARMRRAESSSMQTLVMPTFPWLVSMLPSKATNAVRWKPFFEQLNIKLAAMAVRGELITSKDHVRVWREISEALNG